MTKEGIVITDYSSTVNKNVYKMKVRLDPTREYMISVGFAPESID